MAYRLPSAEEVIATVEAVLAEQGTMGSQTALHRHVIDRLRASDPDYRLGPGRLRRLAIRSGLVRIVVHTRANSDPGPTELCPVCHGDFEQIRNTTLYGGEITLGNQCKRCGFSTGKDWREPARYIFHAVLQMAPSNLDSPQRVFTVEERT